MSSKKKKKQFSILKNVRTKITPNSSDKNCCVNYYHS